MSETKSDLSFDDNFVDGMLFAKQAAYLIKASQSFLVHGDALATLEAFLNCREFRKSKHIIITSPPYGGLHKYSNDPLDLDNLAIEEYLQKLEQFCALCFKLLGNGEFICMVVARKNDTIQALQKAGFNDIETITVKQKSDYEHSLIIACKGKKTISVERELKLANSIWDLTHVWVERDRLGHPCTFCPAIVSDILRVLQIPRDTWVIDPFAGSCTTAEEAKRLGYPFIAVELNARFLPISSYEGKKFSQSLAVPVLTSFVVTWFRSIDTFVNLEWSTPESLLAAKLARADEFIVGHGWHENGIIAQYIRLSARFTDAPLEYAEAAALILAGQKLANADFKFTQKIRTNFFILLLSRTGGRRSTATRLFSTISDIPQLSEGTAQGIIDAIVPLKSWQTFRDKGMSEKDWEEFCEQTAKQYHVIRQTSNSITYYDRDKFVQFNIVIHEFHKLMRQMLNEKGPYANEDAFFNKLYDGLDLSERIRSKEHVGIIDNYFASMFVNTQIESFQAAIANPQLRNSGFLNRFLIYIVDEWQIEPRLPEEVAKVEEHAKKLKLFLEKISAPSFTFDWQIYTKYLQMLIKYQKMHGLDEWVRAEEQMLKIAAVYRFDRWTGVCYDLGDFPKSADLLVEEQDFQDAYEYVIALLNALKESNLLAEARKSVRMPIDKKQKVLQFIEKQKTVTIRVLQQSLNMEGKQLEAILEELMKEGKIKRYDEKPPTGRPRKMVALKES
jgi:DNA modification methylase